MRRTSTPYIAAKIEPDNSAIRNARISTATQDLDRQVDALRSEEIPDKRIYVDKKSGSRPNARVSMKHRPRPATAT